MSVDTASPFVSIQNLIYELPDGRRLFDDLSCSFHIRQTAIVGPNGIGKSVLAKILAGRLSPHAGSVHSQGSISFVPQFWPGSASDSLARVLGIEKAISAIDAIEQGETAQIHYDNAENWWDWRTQLALVGKEINLPNIPDLNRCIGSYSGGEQLRWLWAAALLNSPDIVIMDEPSNHLDRDGREFLNQWLQYCKPLVIVVSHDRELLSKVDHIVELSGRSCVHHSGNIDVYQTNRQRRLETQQSNLQEAKKTMAQQKRETQLALEKHQQRTASGKKQALRKNRSAIEVGAARNKAGNTQQRNSQLQVHRLIAAKNDAEHQAGSAEWMDPIAFTLPSLKMPTRKICTIENYQSSYDPVLHPPISFTLKGAQRLQVIGKNGSGKSLLLNCLAQPATNTVGKIDVPVPVAVLDQHTSNLVGFESGVENYRRLCPGLSEHEYHERLAWLRLRNDKADVAVGDLSGGEQMKIAIAVALLGPQCPQLLILDEPSNHLDLDSLEALEQALSRYSGSLIVVSHDSEFTRKLQISHQLQMETAEFGPC